MANKFEKKRIEMGYLESMYSLLEDKLKDLTRRYEVVGKEEEQARDWRTDELLWEDEEKTIPMYRDKYDYVEVFDDELDDEDRLRMSILNELMAKLEKFA